MTKPASLLTIAIGALYSTLVAQTMESLPVYNLPGRLASFLTEHPGATKRKKVLESLAGRNQTGATFTAIIACDTGRPDIKAKGLEVLTMHQDYRGQPQETTVYLDVDSLRLFQLGLEDDVKTQEFVAAHAQQFDPLELEKPHVAGAVNHVTGAQDLLKIKADKAIVLSAGWYREKESGEFGTYLDSAPGVAIYLPKTPLTKPVEIIATGRAFLDDDGRQPLAAWDKAKAEP